MREKVSTAEVHLLQAGHRLVVALRALETAWDALAAARLVEDPEDDDAWRLPVAWPLRPTYSFEALLERFSRWVEECTSVTGHPHPSMGQPGGWESGYVWALANVHRNKGLKPVEVRMLLELARLDVSQLPPGVDTDEVLKLLATEPLQPTE